MNSAVNHGSKASNQTNSYNCMQWSRICHNSYGGERTGLVVRASDSGSGDPGSILGRVGGLFPWARGIYSPKVLVIPRNRWLRLNMTEKLFTETLNKNQNKTKQFVWSRTRKQSSIFNTLYLWFILAQDQIRNVFVNHIGIISVYFEFYTLTNQRNRFSRVAKTQIILWIHPVWSVHLAYSCFLYKDYIGWI